MNDIEKIFPKVLSEKSAAIYVGMSVQYLRQSRVYGNKETHTPAPPWVKCGRSVRYLISDLDEWLAENRVEPYSRYSNGGA